MNVELMKQAVKNIENDPGSFDMTCWFGERKSGTDTVWNLSHSVEPSSDCGTTACLAGHILWAAGISVDNTSSGVTRHAARALGVPLAWSDQENDEPQTEYEKLGDLFYSCSIETVDELKSAITSSFPEITFE